MALLVNDFDTDIFIEALKLQGDTFDFDEDFPYEATPEELDEAMENLKTRINDAKFATGCSEHRLYITGSANFRYDLLPSYKWRRGKKPIYLAELKQRAIDELGAILIEGIEADDACIMDMTRDENIKKVLKHIDKDLDQVAGTHYNPVTEELYTMSKGHAEDFLWYQVLAGDNADCYRGCPNVGGTKSKAYPEKGGKAMAIAKGTLCVKPFLHTYKKGKNAGTSIIKWIEYHDKSLTREQRIFTWYVKGAYTKGFIGHVKGFENTSGYEQDVKIILENFVFHPNGDFIGLDRESTQFIQREMSIQFMIAKMLTHGMEVPTEVELLNFK